MVYMKLRITKDGVRGMAVSGGTDWEGTGRRLPGAANILYLDLGGGYMDVYIYKNTSSCTLKICTKQIRGRWQSRGHL